MIKSRTRLSRRTFLLAATAGTAATAAALVGHKEPDSKAAAEDSAQSSKGYHLTAHVQNYYRTAKL
jgi:hypothetical protein